MNTEPVHNDPNDPLISIFVYNYDVQYLRRCLESIFNQSVLRNFEVILIDDASSDGSGEIALEYVRRYPRRITFQSNRKVLGPKANLQRCLWLARGRYVVTLIDDHAFLPEYVNHCIETMRADPYAKFGTVYRDKDPDLPLIAPTLPQFPRASGKPPVSILCYNYNYGRYLRQALESVFSQTYENLELCFSDNASTDDSWDIALEFARKYPGKMYLTRNRQNFGPDDNFRNCLRNMGGDYYVNFCSDDVMDPEYVRRCVGVLEENPNTGLVIVNRAVIDENGRRTEEAPFYNESCIIPGPEQAAVYMMAGVNPSVSQIMYRRSIGLTRSLTSGLVTRYYGTRLLDFNVSADCDVGFLKEPLLMHRLHSRSDTSQADANLLPIVGLYVLNHQFADIASVKKLTEAAERLPESVEKVAHLSVRYSVRSLLAGEEGVARRYFHLAAALHPRVVESQTWKTVEEYWSAGAFRKEEILEKFRSADNLATRSVSYDPPPGSMALAADGKLLSDRTRP